MSSEQKNPDKIKITMRLLLGGCLLAERDELFDVTEGVYLTHFQVINTSSIEYRDRMHIKESRVLALDVQSSDRPNGFILTPPASTRVTYYLPGVTPHSDMYKSSEGLKQFDWEDMYQPMQVIEAAQEFWRKFIAR